MLRFTAGDAKPFVETDYQIGISPTSTELDLRDSATGTAVVLFNFYSRGPPRLRSPRTGVPWRGRRRPRRAGKGSPPVWPSSTRPAGRSWRLDPSFAGTLLGFSRDGAQLFVETGTTVSAVGASDLHPISQFTVPAGVSFLGVSPANELVGAVSGTTSWWNPAQGAIVKTSSYSLDRPDLVSGRALRRRHR